MATLSFVLWSSVIKKKRRLNQISYLVQGASLSRTFTVSFVYLYIFFGGRERTNEMSHTTTRFEFMKSWKSQSAANSSSQQQLLCEFLFQSFLAQSSRRLCVLNNVLIAIKMQIHFDDALTLLVSRALSFFFVRSSSNIESVATC